MNTIFWRSKEKQLPPAGAQFYLCPFQGEASAFSPTILTELPAACAPILYHSRIDSPNRLEWIELVQRALEEIKKGSLRKVVLARQTTLQLAKTPNPFEVLAALETKAPNAALFCAQFADKSSFLGASPERLFRRQKDEISVDAMAGTRRWASGMAEELLGSDKDLREFQFVQEYLRESLSPYCQQPLSFSPIATHKSANVQHLYAAGKGTMAAKYPDLHLLKQLHPTPAVCGTPKRAAADWICAQEPFDRQFYSGVIGWSTEEQSDWTVAIRSCSLKENCARLFVGTGIVAGSDPEKEWDELEIKLALYGELFPCGL